MLSASRFFRVEKADEANASRACRFWNFAAIFCSCSHAFVMSGMRMAWQVTFG